MTTNPPSIPEANAQWWVKVVGMLQQNWALPICDDTRCMIYFVDDRSRVFDQLQFDDRQSMIEALDRNGFRDFAADPSLQEFLKPPSFPLSEGEHPNGPIYSSGEFWRS